MADITDQLDQGSPSALDEHAVGNGNSIAGENRGIKRQRPAADDDDDDDDKPGRERRKIEIKFITDKSRRHITFSKRKAGIMKKVRTISSINASPTLLGDRVSSKSSDISSRHMNSQSSLVLRYSFLLSPRLVWCTHSQHQSFNRWSPRPRART